MYHIKHKTIFFKRNHERKITSKILVSLSRKREVHLLKKIKIIINFNYEIKILSF
jgi:hypothetical protein